MTFGSALILKMDMSLPDYSVMDFTFVICKNKTFHEANDECLCEVKFEQYLFQACPNRQKPVKNYERDV